MAETKALELKKKIREEQEILDINNLLVCEDKEEGCNSFSAKLISDTGIWNFVERWTENWYLSGGR